MTFGKWGKTTVVSMSFWPSRTKFHPLVSYIVPHPLTPHGVCLPLGNDSQTCFVLALANSLQNSICEIDKGSILNVKLYEHILLESQPMRKLVNISVVSKTVSLSMQQLNVLLVFHCSF